MKLKMRNHVRRKKVKLRIGCTGVMVIFVRKRVAGGQDWYTALSGCALRELELCSPAGSEKGSSVINHANILAGTLPHRDTETDRGPMYVLRPPDNSRSRWIGRCIERLV